MITYKLGNSLYINLTNRCTNSCSFCIRNDSIGVGYDLWLHKEPSVEEVLEDIKSHDYYDEVVFCGYGEPMTRINELIEISRQLKKNDIRVRINTNGHANLFWGGNVVPALKGLIDSISISLNAKDAHQYNDICSSEYGEAAFGAVLDFTRECVKNVPEVILSVVDVISAHDIEVCRKIAEDMGAKFRIRHYHN